MATPDTTLAKMNGAGQSSALAIVDERLRKQAQFLKMTLPYGKDLTDANAIALSVYCDAFGLNAQNGEAYFLVQPARNGYERKELGLYPGIKAWRKKAKEQLREADKLANYHIDYERIDPAELGIVQAKRGDYALCIRAKLTDDISRKTYLGQYVQLLNAGLKRDEIEDLIGKPPFWIGYGSVKVSELPYLKMEPLRVAEKRAEKDATSRRFDLPFADTEMADDVDAGLVSEIEQPATQRESEPTRQKTDPRDWRKREAKNLAEMGFGDEPVKEGEIREDKSSSMHQFANAAVEILTGEPLDNQDEQPEPESEPGADAPATLFEQEAPNPYADLDVKAEKDPTTASWLLANKIGWKKQEVNDLLKENSNDWAATYKALRRNAPPAA